MRYIIEENESFIESGIMLTGKGSGLSLLIDEVPIYITKVEN
jgi:hypothetical protein